MSLNNSSTAAQCPVSNDRLEIAVNVTRAYISPLLVLFGQFGNLTAFYLFFTHRPWNRFTVYAMALAISDSLVLLSNTLMDDFMGRGLYYLTNKRVMIKLDTMSDASCKLMELVGGWFVFSSGSILVAFSADRVACIYRPLKFRSNAGMRSALAICALIALLGLVLNLPFALLQQLKESQNNDTTCELGIRGDSESLKHLIFILTTLITYTVPCICILVTNALIIGKLLQIRRKRESLIVRDYEKSVITQSILPTTYEETGAVECPQSPPAGDVGLSDLGPDSHRSCRVESKPSGMLRRFMARHSRRKRMSDSRNEVGKIAVLLFLSCFYLCFTSPVSVSLSIRASLPLSDPKCKHAFYGHLTRLLTSVKDINYALNGYIYALFFHFYRQRLFKLLSCSRCHSDCRRCLLRSRLGGVLRSKQRQSIPVVHVTSYDNEDIVANVTEIVATPQIDG